MNGNVDGSNEEIESLATMQPEGGMKSSFPISQQQRRHNFLSSANTISNGENSETMPHLRSGGYVQNAARKPTNNGGGVSNQKLGNYVAREVRELREPFLNYPGQEQGKKPKPQAPIRKTNASGNKHSDLKRQQTQNMDPSKGQCEGFADRNLLMLSDAGSNLRDSEQQEQGTTDLKLYHRHEKENQYSRGPKTAMTADSRPLTNHNNSVYTSVPVNNTQPLQPVMIQVSNYNRAHTEERFVQDIYHNDSECVPSYRNQEDHNQEDDFLAECDDVSDEGQDFQGVPSPIKTYANNSYSPPAVSNDGARNAAFVSCNRGDYGNGKQKQHELCNQQEENLGHVFVPDRGSSNASTGDYSSLDKSAIEKAYIRDCQKKGIMDDQLRLSSEARMVARDKAWKLYKFASSSLMEYDSPMATMIMAEMGKLTDPYDSVFQSQLWTRIKRDVLTGIGQARSGSTQRIQKAFFGKFVRSLDNSKEPTEILMLIAILLIADLHATGKLPDLKTMEMGRQYKDSYVHFAMSFASGVVKAVNWKENIKSRKYSEIVNTSDEAMAFLILANNWNVWTKMAEQGTREGKMKMKDIIDEDQGVTQQFFVKDGRGFSFNLAGKKYFNDMFKKIKADREEHAQEFDNHLYGLMNKNENEKSKSKKKRRYEDDVDFECENDGAELAGFHQQMIADKMKRQVVDNNGNSSDGLREQLHRNNKTASYNGQNIPFREV